MSETFSPMDMAQFIIFNKMRVDERRDLFEVDEDCLQKIFNRMKEIVSRKV